MSDYDDNNGKKNISIEEELNRLSKGIQNGADLQAYLLTCIEKHLEIKPLIRRTNTEETLKQEETLKKELAKVIDLDTKMIRLVEYLTTKINPKKTKKQEETKSSSTINVNEFTFIINNIINALKADEMDAIKPLLNAINIINKINKDLNHGQIFINQQEAEEKTAVKEEKKSKQINIENHHKSILKQHLALLDKTDNINNTEIKKLIELELELMLNNQGRSIISRSKNILSNKDKNKLIEDITKLLKNLQMKLSRKSEYVKIFENILQIIKTYDIQSSKEAQKAAHAKIYTIIDNIKAKKLVRVCSKKKRTSIQVRKIGKLYRKRTDAI